VKYCFVLAFITVFLLFDKRLGYTDTSPVWTHFTYMFQHAGTGHLILNSVAFIGMFRTLKGFMGKWRLAVAIVAIAFAASFLSLHALPTVGASGMVYAMTGILLGGIASKKIRTPEKKQLCMFILAVTIALASSFFKNGSNFWLHAICMATGFLTATGKGLKKPGRTSRKHTLSTNATNLHE
jgi:membrane associated rhomboid family serine protease